MKILQSSILAIGAFAVAVGAEPAPSVGAAPGPVQVWNCPRWQTVSIGDYSGINPEMKALKPIELLGTRNGVSSGFVVVTRDNAAIKGLKATMGDLALSGEAGRTIPAASCSVRFADLVWWSGKEMLRSWAADQKSGRFDRLLEQVPAEVPMPEKFAYQWWKPERGGKVATVPVWVTVRVPAGAAAGDYRGTLSIEAEGLSPSPVQVPVRLKVHDWAMPDPKDFRVRTLGWMNPEALARHYRDAGLKFELWSDKHFELMGRSMELMAELGSRQVNLTVTMGYPIQDNQDTMIKWVRQADGSYKYDFAVFDRYCDLIEKKIGKPFPMRINIWHGPGDRPKGDHPQRPVLVKDPATGEVSELPICPALGSEEDRKFWKPFFDELRARLDKRGWTDVAGCNWINYCGLMVNPRLVDMVQELWPGHRWTDVDHADPKVMPTSQKGVTVPIFVQSTVWREGTWDAYVQWTSGPYPRKYAGKFDPATAYCSQGRLQIRDGSSLWTYRSKHEEMILKGHDGLDMVGADMFPARPRKGGWQPGLWSWAAQGPNNSIRAILGAGDDGPVGSQKFEAMREGIQLCEAMVFIQKALEAGKLSGDLEARANKVLDDRARTMVACLKDTDPDPKITRLNLDLEEYAEGSFQRDSELYATAGEVARAIADK